MARLRCRTVLDPAALLHAATGDVLEPRVPPGGAWPTLSTWVVVRQGGLRDDVHAAAAARGIPGWFGAPVITFAELFPRWGPPAPRRPVTEAERWVLVADLLDLQGGGEFPGAAGTEAWVPYADRVIGELVGEGVPPDRVTAALSALDATDAARWAVIAGVYRAWHDMLDRWRRRDARGDRAALARWIREDPVAFAARLDGRTTVRVLGLADLRGGWAPLLRALAASDAVDELAVFSTAPLPWPDDLAVALEPAPPGHGAAAALFTDAPAVGGPVVTFVEAPDPARELELVAVAIRRLVDAGVAPARIAVVAREARPLVDAAAAALDRVGVPVTVRRRTALAHTAPARAVLALLDGAADGWSRHTLVELAEQPLLDTGLDAALVNLVGFGGAVRGLDAWAGALDDLARRAAEREGGSDDDPRVPLPAAGRVQAQLAAWTALAPRLRQLDAPRSLAAWFDWLRAVLTEPGWGVPARLAATPDGGQRAADEEAARRLADLAGEWAAALAAVAGPGRAMLPPARFADRLRLLLLDADLVAPPTTDFGVTVAEALAFACRATDHLFLIGGTAGALPRRQPLNPLLDDDVRAALVAAGVALDPLGAWRVRERELFRALVAAPRVALAVSWSATDAVGGEVARSAFVDELLEVVARAGDRSPESLVHAVPACEVLVPGFPLVRDGATADAARATAERERARGVVPTPYDGLLEATVVRGWLDARYGEDHEWSASQLEGLARCGWSWLAAHVLRLDPRADPDDAMEPTVRGEIAHEALAHLYATLGQTIGTPVYLRDAHADLVDRLVPEAVDAAWRAAAARGIWLGAPLLATLAREEIAADLRRFLRAEMAEHEKSFGSRSPVRLRPRTGVVAGELAFDGVAFAADGTRFRLRGRIDRLERGVDERVPGAERLVAVVDYKSSRHSVPAGGDAAGWEDGVVLQAPLYALAVRQLHPELEVARVEYRVLRDGTAQHVVVPMALDRQEALVHDAAAVARLEAAVGHAARRVAQVRRGELPAAPAPSCGCPPYCVARDVCRIPGGPREPPR